MAEIPEICAHPEDPFDSISDPMELLLAFSRQLHGWALSIQEEYGGGGDYIQDHIDSSVREHITKGRLIVYSDVDYSIYSDMVELQAESNELLWAVYRHKSTLLSNREVSSLLLEAIGTFQLFVDKVNDVMEGYEDALGYCMYDETSLGRISKIYGNRVFDRFKRREELKVDNYEHAFEEIRRLTDYIEESKIGLRFEEFAAKLKTFCKLEMDSPTEIDKIEAGMGRKEIRTLLDKDIVKAIARVLGKNKKKRLQIVKETAYQNGGHIGETLTRLKRKGILKHERPYYWVNPKFYNDLGICPDKDGQ